VGHNTNERLRRDKMSIDINTSFSVIAVLFRETSYWISFIIKILG